MFELEKPHSRRGCIWDWVEVVITDHHLDEHYNYDYDEGVNDHHDHLDVDYDYNEGDEDVEVIIIMNS